MKKIVIATRNKGKVKEFQDFFNNYGIQVESLLDLKKEIADVEETGESFEENATLKAEQIASLLNQPVLADDSGLMVDALDGAPGIYSARYAEQEKSDEANNQKLLNEMANVPKEKRSARFVCVLAIAVPGEATILFRGECEGEIAFEPQGINGFGYDPLFIPIGYEQTMAELNPEEKNKISHRKQAIKQLESSGKTFNLTK